MSRLWRRTNGRRRKVENRAVFCWTRNRKRECLQKKRHFSIIYLPNTRVDDEWDSGPNETKLSQTIMWAKPTDCHWCYEIQVCWKSDIFPKSQRTGDHQVIQVCQANCLLVVSWLDSLVVNVTRRPTTLHLNKVGHHHESCFVLGLCW